MGEEAQGKGIKCEAKKESEPEEEAGRRLPLLGPEEEEPRAAAAAAAAAGGGPREVELGPVGARQGCSGGRPGRCG